MKAAGAESAAFFMGTVSAFRLGVLDANHG